VTDGINEKTALNIARNHRRPVVTSAADTSATVEQEPTLDFRGARRMTFVAVRHQNRTNPLLEEVDLVRVRVSGTEQTQGDNQREQTILLSNQLFYSGGEEKST
jgi:hypothetical protein